MRNISKQIADKDNRIKSFYYDFVLFVKKKINVIS